MRKHRFSRALASLLAMLMLVQSLCLTAFAAETTDEPIVDATVIIAKGNTDGTNQILTETLRPDAEETLEWEYLCTGTIVLSSKTNDAWGSVKGFTSTTKSSGFFPITYTYTHAALADNEDGVYQVRLADEPDAVYKVYKKQKDKSDASVEWNSGASAVLVNNDDGSINVDATKANIFDAVVKSIEPELTVSDVTITYYATPTTGSLGSAGKAWMPLAGGTKNWLTYPAIGIGANQNIMISWDGNDDYKGFEKEVPVDIVSGLKTSVVTCNDPIDTVKLSYNEDMTVDYDALKADIFSAVVQSTEPSTLTADDVAITYYATAATGSLGSVGKEWMPLKGGTKDLLTYPAISAGNQQIRISWDGDKEYDGFSKDVNITIVDREALTFNLKEAPYEVSLIFDEEQGIDYDKTAEAIFDAVVESTNPAVEASDVDITYSATAVTGLVQEWMPLKGGTKNLLTYPAISAGNQQIRISWGGNQEYAGSSVIVNVNMSDNRAESAVVLKDGASFTYNKDVEAIKQEIFDNVIDWDNSSLPDKDTLTVDDFTFTYLAEISLLDGATGDIADKIVDSILDNSSVKQAYVPFEGKDYDLGSTTLGSYPRIGAGEQQIRIVYNGNAGYKSSAEADGTVTINKASVKVSVKTTSMYVSEAQNGLNLVTTNPADDDIDLYTLYAGITSNVTTIIYLELPVRYTSDSTFVKVVDGILAGLGQSTLTQVMQDGITVGQLRELLNTSEVIEALEKLGVDTGSFGQIVTVVNKLPSIGDNIRIAFGTPVDAGVYTVAAITDSSNYKTAVGMGALVLKADKGELVWNNSVNKISTAEAASFDFGATLQVNGTAVNDQSGIKVLYSGVTSKWKVYSSTTTAPAEPGRYTQTVVVLGGNYVAAPITRSFQITK